MAPANQYTLVQSVRARYPTPLGARHAEFLLEVARATRAKLLRKEAGSNIALPSGVHVSQDILMFDGFGIDVLSDAEGAAIPTWQEKGPIVGEYIDVSEPGQDPPADPGDVGAAIADLQRRVGALEGRKYRIELEAYD